MGAPDTLSAIESSQVPAGYAISIVIISGPLGGIFGGSFTTHVVSSETMAVWLTTVVIAVFGLSLLAVRS
jgi:hypothetical protein